MANNRIGSLALYLIGLAILENNGETYVNKEIREAIKEIKQELELKE